MCRGAQENRDRGSRNYSRCRIAGFEQSPYAGRVGAAAEQIVESHLRQMEDAIRYVESTALLIRNALLSGPSIDALKTTLDHRLASLLSTVDDQLAALDRIREDINELRVHAHGSRRRRPRP